MFNMKIIYAASAVAASTFFIGCKDSSATGGGTTNGTVKCTTGDDCRQGYGQACNIDGKDPNQTANTCVADCVAAGGDSACGDGLSCTSDAGSATKTGTCQSTTCSGNLDCLSTKCNKEGEYARCARGKDEFGRLNVSGTCECGTGNPVCKKLSDCTDAGFTCKDGEVFCSDFGPSGFEDLCACFTS